MFITVKTLATPKEDLSDPNGEVFAPVAVPSSASKPVEYAPKPWRRASSKRTKEKADALLKAPGWFPIPGHPHYMINRDGMVKTLARETFADPDGWHRPRLLAENLMTSTRLKSGYWVVGLTENGKTKSYYLHHLLAITFHGPCPEGYRLKILKDDRQNWLVHADEVKYVPLKRPHRSQQLSLKLKVVPSTEPEGSQS